MKKKYKESTKKHPEKVSTKYLKNIRKKYEKSIKKHPYKLFKKY